MEDKNHPIPKIEARMDALRERFKLESGLDISEAAPGLHLLLENSPDKDAALRTAAELRQLGRLTFSRL